MGEANGSLLAGHVRVVVIGAGFAGIASAAQLILHGEDDLLVFEQAPAVGGTWQANTYPGAACDVPSQLYSLSFAPNPEWTGTFPPQAEIQAYLDDVVDQFGVRERLRLNHRVLETRWDDETRRWRVLTDRGTWTAEHVIYGYGPLSEPKLPDIPGLDSFAGERFHSARWNHDCDLAGRRVAVIGSGASAVQFVPQIQPLVSRLTLFQRTPGWVIPRGGRTYGRMARSAFRKFPLAGRLVRGFTYRWRELLVLAMRHPDKATLIHGLPYLNLWRGVRKDPELRKRLTPDWSFGCKRVLISDHFYPAMAQPNVDLVTEKIIEVRPEGVVTADGLVHETDVIVLATGFLALQASWADHVIGRDGRSLTQYWDGSPMAHLGITVPNYPNFSMLLGPNTALGHTSVIVMIEAQVEHIVRMVLEARAREAAVVEVTVEAFEGWRRRVDDDLVGTVWVDGGCDSLYYDNNRRVAAIWPHFTTQYRKRLRAAPLSDYTFSA